MAYTTIDDPSAYFQTTLYSGTGSSQAVTNTGNSDLQPDWVWLKVRSNGTYGHVVFDSVRGVNKALFPNANNVEEDQSSDVSLSSFNSDGFTVGGYFNNVNQSGQTFVSWQWKKTADAGFDIVTATGNATAKTISHSLSAIPHVMIAKEKSGSVNDWTIYHHKNTAAPETDSLILNETNATADQNTHWNDTAPTSSVFTVGTGSVVNRNSSTYVYYLFSEKQGYSKFGSYKGNGNADGTFVYTGFKPAFFLGKRTNSSGEWFLLDNKRNNSFNPQDRILETNSNSADISGSSYKYDFLSNGIKIRTTSQAYGNGSGDTFLYMAFAEQPFVTSTGIPTTAR